MEKISILFLNKLGAHGWSTEEIKVRKHDALWKNIETELHLHDFQHHLFPQCNDVGFQAKFITGSSCEGLEGNSFVKKTPSDVDIILLNLEFNILDIKNKGLAHDTINNNSELIESKRPTIFIEEDTVYPGYVRLIVIRENVEKYLSRLDSYDALRLIMGDMKEGLPQLVTEYNGPAVTLRNPTNRKTQASDYINCLWYKGWPRIANEWLSRERPYGWPSKKTVEFIQSGGCIIAPVGHHDYNYDDSQWRISFKEEGCLVSQLNHIQTLCYVILKRIVKLKLHKIAKDAITSFHVKNTIFWCAECLLCNWTTENLLACSQECIKRFRSYIANRNLPHYIIKRRNLFNSKLTNEISTNVCSLLGIYEDNMLNIFRIRITKIPRKIMNFRLNSTFLEFATTASIIYSCFFISIQNLEYNTIYWLGTCKLLNFCNVSQGISRCGVMLDTFSKHESIYAKPFINLLENIMGMLYFAKYKETKEEIYLSRADQFLGLNHKNITCSPPILLRVVMFLYMKNKYNDALQLCLQYKADEFYYGDFQVRTPGTTKRFRFIENQMERIYNSAVSVSNELISTVKEIILCVFYGKDSIDELPADFSHSGCQLIKEMKDIPNFYFRITNLGVPLLNVEKWVVPAVLRFELISERSGLTISTSLCSLLMSFLCNRGIGNVHDTISILVKMEFYLDNRHLEKMMENKKEFNSFYSKMRRSKKLYKVDYTGFEYDKAINEVHDLKVPGMDNDQYLYCGVDYDVEKMYQSYNIVAYCNLKARRHEKVAGYLLKSLKLHPSRSNTAYGYLKIIILVLNEICDTVYQNQ